MNDDHSDCQPGQNELLFAKGRICEALDSYRLGRLEEARSICQDILRLIDNDPFVLGLLATTEKSLGNKRIAISLFEASLELNPDGADFHHNYAGLLDDDGDLVKALYHSKRAVTLDCTNSKFLERYGYLKWKEGSVTEALEATKTAVALNPRLVDAYINLAAIHYEAGDIPSSIQAGLRAIDNGASSTSAYLNLALAYAESLELDKATNAIRQAIGIDPSNPSAYSELARILRSQGKIDEALLACERALQLDDCCDQALYMRGILKQATGRISEGKRDFESALALSGEKTDSLFELSKDIVTSSDARRLVARTRDLRSKRVSKRKLSMIEFASANFYHSLKDYDSASRCLKIANSLKLSFLPSDAEQLAGEIQAWQRPLNLPKIHDYKTRDGFIFLVGLPRCGSTLLDVVLRNNREAHSIGESNALAKTYLRAKRLAGSEGVGSLTETYLAFAGITHINARFIIDKQLYNFIYGAQIATHMRTAKVVHCRRNPLDHILSMFRSNLTVGNNFTASLCDAATMLVLQEKTMNLYKERWPHLFATFSYDSFVKEPRDTLIILIDWLGWQWNDAYLSPTKSNKEIVNTASVIQARQPIYTSSTGGWRRYHDLLNPAREIILESGLFKDYDLT